MQKILYASATRYMMYAHVYTRPDIAYIVRVLGWYLSNPGLGHWKAAKRVMAYLQRTKDHMLTYQKSYDLEIIGYFYYDFARYQDSRNFTSCFIFLLVGGAIFWHSAKQSLIASSTMAAEFVAVYEASNKELWLSNFTMGCELYKKWKDH